MLPTVKTMMKKLNIDLDTAKKIRGLMDGRLNPRKVSEQCDKWVRQCHNMPSVGEMAMCAIDDVLGTHGVEAIEFPNDYHIAYTYCNTGDSYALTVVRDHEKCRYLIAAWGDLQEKLDREYESQ